jgi:hypothetical protein
LTIKITGGSVVYSANIEVGVVGVDGRNYTRRLFGYQVTVFIKSDIVTSFENPTIVIPLSGSD